eukprot:m51a1_g11499 putative glycerol kinase (283) ;mRNA; f:13-1268
MTHLDFWISLLSCHTPVPVAAHRLCCLGDQQAALVGEQCFAEGSVKNTCGTGCFALLNTGGSPVVSRHGLITTVAYKLGPAGQTVYALEGAVAAGGSALQWYKDNLCADSADLDEIAATVEDAGGVCFVPALAGLSAPYWRPDARGAIVGLTQYSTRAHIVRALLESMCHQSADVLGAMEADTGVAVAVLPVDGRRVRDDLLPQLLADITGIPVVRAEPWEATSLGAAIAAGIAVGVWEVEGGRVKGVEVHASRFEPRTSAEQRAAANAQWRKALERSLDWV